MSDTPAASRVEVTFRFSAPSVHAAFEVVSCRVAEALSEPYTAAVVLATLTHESLSRELLGASAVLSFWRGDRARTYRGVVCAVEDRGTTADQRVYEVVLVPALWQLGLRSAYRVFQSADAIEIVREILRDAGLYQTGAGLVTPAVALKPREYCVQYGETDLAVLRRLLDEEGFAFGFGGADDEEQLVIFDPAQERGLGAVEGVHGAVSVYGNGLATADEEGVASLDASREIVAGGMSVTDWDFTHSAAPVWGHTTGDSRGRLLRLHPARAASGLYHEDTHRYGVAELAQHARLRLEATRQSARLLMGDGNVTPFSAGRVVDLQESGPRTLRGRYLLTRVVHVGQCPEVLYAGGDEVRNLDRYSNHFECSPLGEGHVWRPTITARPRVDGPQTALVMAEQGSSDEICTDHHGRVLVQFHWDAHGGRVASQRAKRSSCWIRVAQNWAGGGWGFLFVPRVGMEVIVQFLDGDPDRPMITGCVYNGAHGTPAKLPQHKTQSMIRTQSSPGGAGYNELRFEDAAGAEHVWFRAQKDHTAHVLHDHKENVDHDQTTVVKHDSFLEVGNDRAIVVKGNEKHAVTRNQGVSVKGNALREVTGNESLVVHKSRTTHVDQEWKLTADEGASVEVGGSAKLDMKPDEILMEAPSGITFKCGDNKIAMTPTGITLQTSAGAKVVLQGPMVNVEGGANVTVKAGAMLTIQGVLVKIN
jgi:type VI secretion system secreted protein VgrG